MTAIILLTIQRKYIEREGGGGCNYVTKTTFPSYTRFAFPSFFPSFVSTSFTYHFSSQFLPVLHLFLRLFFPFSSPSPSLYFVSF